MSGDKVVGAAALEANTDETADPNALLSVQSPCMGTYMVTFAVLLALHVS